MREYLRQTFSGRVPKKLPVFLGFAAIKLPLTVERKPYFARNTLSTAVVSTELSMNYLVLILVSVKSFSSSSFFDLFFGNNCANYFQSKSG